MVKEFLEYVLFELGDYVFTVQKLVYIIVVIIVTKLVLYLVNKALFGVKRLKNERPEDLYTLDKIISYIIWIISLVIILNSLGLKVTAILTGSAALLVGVGLGLQQTFNDFISGVILLFEGKTKVGDVLDIDGRLMTLSNIGLRTTEGVDRDGISIIIPNSKIVTDKVINLSHSGDKKIRFRIKVGVAYGSDVELVIQLLELCATEHPKVVDKDKVEARFVDFGDSSLNFELLFFSKTIFRVERIKSDIRRAINLRFIENDVTIPFPQLDVHFQSNDKKMING